MDDIKFEEADTYSANCSAKNHRNFASDKCRGMETILDNTAMIQQNACELVYVRRIAQPLRKRNVQAIRRNVPKV
ncbi:hypothetical protein ACTXT7_012405 [Hymenolepis weldensis]